MTAEAALTKLSYLLGKGLPVERIKELMMKNLCGEMTLMDLEQKQLRDSDLLTSIAQAMNLSSTNVSAKILVGINIKCIVCVADKAIEINVMLALKVSIDQREDFQFARFFLPQ